MKKYLWIIPFAFLIMCIIGYGVNRESKKDKSITELSHLNQPGKLFVPNDNDPLFLYGYHCPLCDATLYLHRAVNCTPDEQFWTISCVHDQCPPIQYKWYFSKGEAVTAYLESIHLKVKKVK